MPRQSPPILGTVIVKNLTAQIYVVEELNGVEIQPGAQLDLMAADTPHRYVEYQAANRLVTNLPTAKLYQDIQAGKISIVKNERIKP